MVRGIVDLARTLDLTITAEGIETELQATVSELGCDLGQGYWFARPVPAAEIPALLTRGVELSKRGLDHASLERAHAS
jgi:EAL domain-containing protein (putative c-di-GMP-specific phosphodiesterase class I)